MNAKKNTTPSQKSKALAWVVEKRHSIVEPGLQLLVAEEKIELVFVHVWPDPALKLKFYLRVKTTDGLEFWLCTRRAPVEPRKFSKYEWIMRYLTTIGLDETEREVIFDEAGYDVYEYDTEV